MGYCYDGAGRLACDACDRTGGVRKRTCPHKVSGLPYCPAPALCRECYAKRRATLHKGCKAGAEAAQARDDAEAEAIAGGAFLVRSAFGDWHENVPAGEVGVVFHGRGGQRRYALVSAHEYSRPGARTKALADFEARPWFGPDAQGPPAGDVFAGDE